MNGTRDGIGLGCCGIFILIGLFVFSVIAAEINHASAPVHIETSYDGTTTTDGPDGHHVEDRQHDQVLPPGLSSAASAGNAITERSWKTTEEEIKSRETHSHFNRNWR